MWVGMSAVGVMRTDDSGAEWQDLSKGLPSRFGLPMAVHPRDPKTVYVLPEDKGTIDNGGAGRRYVPDAKMRVYRSRNAGEDWEPLTRGLPQENASIHVMREGMATDDLDPCGVYIGTSTGQVFYSRDEGLSWELMIEYLPPINSLETTVVG